MKTKTRNRKTLTVVKRSKRVNQKSSNKLIFLLRKKIRSGEETETNFSFTKDEINMVIRLTGKEMQNVQEDILLNDDAYKIGALNHHNKKLFDTAESIYRKLNFME